MQCLQCGNEFNSKRVTAKYCGRHCRKLAFQQNGKISVPKISVPVVEQNAKIDAKLPVNYGLSNCECQHCKQNKASNHRLNINHGDWKPTAQLGCNEVNRVSLPFDIDYKGVCVL